MKIWFDTEFIEDGKTIELISIGMIRADDAIYYAEVEGVDYSRADPWVQENVITHLVGVHRPRRKIAEDIIRFAGEKPEFWAYYADYDWVVLCQLFGRMMDLPSGWPMFCRDVKQLCDSMGNPKLPPQVDVEHHALSDAVWTKKAHEFLEMRAAA